MGESRSGIACWFCFDFPSHTSIVRKCRGKKHNRNVNILMTMLLTPFFKTCPSFKSHIWLNSNFFDTAKKRFIDAGFGFLFDSIKVSAQNDKNQWIDLRQFSNSHGKFWMQSKKDKIFFRKKNWRTFDLSHYCSRMSSFVFAFRLWIAKRDLI